MYNCTVLFKKILKMLDIILYRVYIKHIVKNFLYWHLNVQY